jgi:hypothetical protein
LPYHSSYGLWLARWAPEHPYAFIEGTGGVTEPLRRRIVLPMAGPLADTDHVIGHELVHAFQFDIKSPSAPTAASWNRNEKPSTFGGSRESVASAGVAFRVNLLGLPSGSSTSRVRSSGPAGAGCSSSTCRPAIK